ACRVHWIVLLRHGSIADPCATPLLAFARQRGLGCVLVSISHLGRAGTPGPKDQRLRPIHTSGREPRHAWRRTQVVKGEVCKTSMLRFESTRRLSSSGGAEPVQMASGLPSMLSRGFGRKVIVISFEP